MARTSCTAEGCKARKANHKMYEVKRSRADPTVLGYACSRGCAAKVLAADSGPAIQPSAEALLRPTPGLWVGTATVGWPVPPEFLPPQMRGHE